MANSTRERQSKLTREAILDAARRLFATQGFANTSVRLLAAEAGVAIRTVYLLFGSKQGVLMNLTYAISAPGVEQAQHFDPEVRDPQRLIGAVARAWRDVYERSGDIITMLREGAASEPVLRDAMELGLSVSRVSIEGICARLDGLGALRPGLSVDEASGHALVLVSDDGRDELVRRRGWSYDRYESWLRTALEDLWLVPSSKR